MKKLRLIALLCTLSLVFLPLSGCKKASDSYFSYRTSTFSVRLTGTKDGAPLSCDIYCDGGSMQKIIYLSPEALCGLTLTSHDSVSICIEKDGISLEYPYDECPFLPLLFPARILLLEGADDASVCEVQRISTGCLVTVSLPSEPQPIRLDLNRQGFPTVLSGEHFSFQATTAPLF